MTSKPKEELVADLKQQNLKKFLAESDEHRNAMVKKYKLQLVPVIQYTPQGAYPVFGTQEVKEEVEQTPTDEQINTTADSDATPSQE